MTLSKTDTSKEMYTLLKASTQAVEISNKCTRLQQHLDQYTHVHVYVDIKCFHLLSRELSSDITARLFIVFRLGVKILQYLYLVGLNTFTKYLYLLLYFGVLK